MKIDKVCHRLLSIKKINANRGKAGLEPFVLQSSQRGHGSVFVVN